jgi:hypothetical protein
MSKTASSCSNVSNAKSILTLAQAQDDEAARSFAAVNAKTGTLIKSES